jgi:hypothetical protein
MEKIAFHVILQDIWTMNKIAFVLSLRLLGIIKLLNVSAHKIYMDKNVLSALLQDNGIKKDRAVNARPQSQSGIKKIIFVIFQLLNNQ